MIEIEVSTPIDRPVDEVFAFVTDPANRPRWDTSVVSEQLTSAGPLAVGSTLHTRMRVLGQDAEFDWRVQQYAPPRTLGVTSTAGPLATTMVLTLAPTGSGAELTASLTAQPEGMMRIVEPIIEQSIRRDLTAALDRLRSLLESGPR